MSFYRKMVQRYPDSYTAQILAQDTHRSNLISRLISAFDSMDAIRMAHKQEVDDLQHHIDTLDARNRMLKRRVKSAEMERDELREGVERLVEKVEIANDYRIFTCLSTHPAHPYFQEPIRKHPSQELEHSPDTKPLLSVLVSQLTFTKLSYKQLKQSTDARIALLEAQIARRDLELQSCRPCTCLASHVHGSQPNVAGPFGTRVSDDDAKHSFTRVVEAPLNQHLLHTFSREEGLQVLEETASHQRILQTEIAALCERASLSLDNEKKLLSEAITPSEKVKSPQVRIPSAVGESRISTTMETIEQHVHRLDFDAKDMRAEYDNIADFISPANDDDEQHLKRCFLLEEECIRRRKSEQELRQKLLLAFTTEDDLRNLVNKLQEQLRDQNTQDVDNAPFFSINDPVITPAMTRMNQVQTELEQAQLEVDERQLIIDELRGQIALLRQQTQNIEDNG